ncbi:hypothetical protein ABIA06_004134 [Bradyrhizobium yuanmingense]
MDAFAVGIAAGDLLLGLGQQRDVLRHHARFEAGIGIGRRGLGGVGGSDVGRTGRAGDVGSRVGERGVAHPAIAAPIGGIAHPHQDVVEYHHRGNLGLRQHRRQVLGDEGHFRVGLDGFGIVGIVGRRLRVGADIGQQALGVERRDLRRQIARRHRQIAGDPHERTHPHHVTVADAGNRRDAHHVARGGGFARRRQAVALVQRGGTIGGAECSAQRAFDPLRHLGEGHLAVERSENGAADQGCAAESGQNCPAEPLHRDAAAVDHRGFRTIDGQRRLVAEIDDPGLTPVSAA